MTSVPKVVIIPHTAWHVPQRFHHFTPRLAQSFDVHAMNWDATFSTPADLMSWRYLLNALPRRWEHAAATVHHVPRVTPAGGSRLLRSVNEALYQATLRRVLDRERPDVVVGSFVTSPPVGLPKVLDVCDDHVGLWKARGVLPAYASEIAEREAAWVKASRFVVAVSSVLADRLRAEHPRAEVVHVPNGVDLQAFRPGREAARRALGMDPERLYVGNIGALDNVGEARRLLAVARALEVRPNARLLVVGRGRGAEWLRREATRLSISNLELHGFASGERLVKLFQAVDVGTCPYELSIGDDARVPMRLLHYSAVGARVVCTVLEEVERMAFENVTLCDDDDAAFAAAVLRALDADPCVPEAVHQYDAVRLADTYAEILRAAAS